VAQVLIIGGGLGGLHAARLLHRAGVDHVLLEGAPRLGGRILSEGVAAAGAASAYDLGPAWFWPAFQHRMPALVAELGLRAFPQHMDGALMWEESATTRTRFDGGAPMDGSMRLAGGLQALTTALADDGGGECVELEQRVTAIRLAGQVVEVDAVDTGGAVTTRTATRVISTLPPRLLARTVAFDPPLPPETVADWVSVPTWMAGQAKVIAVYERPFWREAGLSGEARSRVGPMVEIHDASAEAGLPALSGFVGVPAEARVGAGARITDAAVAQLERLFGPDAAHPIACLYKNWAADPLVATTDDLAPLLAHPAYGRHMPPPGPWARRLVLAGTETAHEQGGYMEGALVASEAAARVC
jgi:monoamine oxidase